MKWRDVQRYRDTVRLSSAFAALHSTKPKMRNAAKMRMAKKMALASTLALQGHTKAQVPKETKL